MSDLAQRVRNARIFRFEFATDKALMLRRPTDAEFNEVHKHIAELNKTQATLPETVAFVSGYVAGWEGVTEADLFDGGAQVSVQFDAAALVEWISDRGDIALQILRRLVDEFLAFKKKVDEAKKK